MESSIEYQNLRSVGHYAGAACDTHQVRTCMKRCEVYALLQYFNYFIGNEDGLREVRTAVHYTVTDCFDLAHILDATDFGIGKNVYQNLGSNAMIGHFDFFGPLYAVFGLVVNTGACDADTIAETLCSDCAGVGINQLILQRRAAGVNN
jgi:hypothetical protein